MAKRAQNRNLTQASPMGQQQSLGAVIRFAPKAGLSGVRQLEAGGFRVASSNDFRKAAAVPNNLDGADVQYFERFGIAVVRGDGDRLNPILTQGESARTIGNCRPERIYTTLGWTGSALQQAGSSVGLEPQPTIADAVEGLANFGPDYLTGYRDGVNHLIERLLAGSGEMEAVRFASRFNNSSVTWGLDAVKANLSGLSGAGIKVAVLDTGFDDKHPDFSGRSITKKLFASRSSTGDVDGHGTHCIGTACGPLKPQKGPRYGIAYQADIFAGKVLGDDGFGTDRSIIAGMEWALDEGCAIISMSLGSPTRIGDQANDDYEQIGRVCLDAGTLVIAAAGNESRRPGRINPVGSPANASTIIAVAAVDRTLQLASFSCGGLNPNQDVDLAAPGVDILSSALHGGTILMSGTSMATPHVAGIAALIAQSNPSFRGRALWKQLTKTVLRLNKPVRDVGKGLAQAPRN